MNNRDIYAKDPSIQKLVNEGVASVNDDKTSQSLAVLKYELETFVCSGQYKWGISHILDVFLKNIGQAQQPAVWISGFFGSGKSHLSKMLHALWVNTVLPDGSNARGIAQLSDDIRASLVELDNQGRRHGGLHAASGTLGASSSDTSVRLALLRIIFKSVELPEQYPIAHFVMWLKKEGIYEKVRSFIEEKGCDWNEELDNFYVSAAIVNALLEIKSDLFSSAGDIRKALNDQYKIVNDISIDEMTNTIYQALVKDGKFPLTLVILDEIQQYIGENSDRSLDVQNVTEACSKKFGGKLMFVGTGQTAITGTSNLMRLQGRFTVRVELSDTDVEAVIRQVILAKLPNARNGLDKVMQDNIGEISRHLSNTTLRYKEVDNESFYKDYPILPVRRRFWEQALRVLDQTGTASQLRDQLNMTHKAVQSNLDKPLGNIISADFLYYDSANKMLQQSILPRPVHDMTSKWYAGSEEEKLMARACGLVFLINKLGDQKKSTGIRSDVNTLADLMIDDLYAKSDNLRKELPVILDECELLMKVDDEYRIQTEESVQWNNDFGAYRNNLNSESHQIEGERNELIRNYFKTVVPESPLFHGKSRIKREVYRVFENQLPDDKDNKILLWIRDGWSVDEKTVRDDAIKEGDKSPVISVFLPKDRVDELRNNIINHKASSLVLEKRGINDNPESREAKGAMETVKNKANGKIQDILAEIFSKARVFQGGGNELTGDSLQDMIGNAIDNSLKRLYTKFNQSDNSGWGKVYEKAKRGVTDALEAVGHDGEIASNPVCREILSFIGNRKVGSEIRTRFENPPYGWSGDTMDGAILILLLSGNICGQDERGHKIDAPKLERKAIGKTIFSTENITISVKQNMAIRGLFQKAGISSKSDENLQYSEPFLREMLKIAKQAGGEAPKPTEPDTGHICEIMELAGNERLLAIYESIEELGRNIEDWKKQGKAIDQRWPNWQSLERLMIRASGLEGVDDLVPQADVIREERRLLDDPDSVAPLIGKFAQILRAELNKLEKNYNEGYLSGKKHLDNDVNWKKLNEEQKQQLLDQSNLKDSNKPIFKVQSTADILETLDNYSLKALCDTVDALPKRFDDIMAGAAEILEPEVKKLKLPSSVLRNEKDVENWLSEKRKILLNEIKNGPILI